MRGKKAVINMLVALIGQILTIFCGLIIPRLIIQTFGSGVNGLTSSINQFLGYIILLEAGVGGVVRAALYKPLADKDIFSISGIIKATEKFFKVIAIIFIGYLFVLAIVFPLVVKDEFNFIFTFTLVLIIGISMFFQYYFGITYQILLQADQRQYVNSILQIITILLNAILVVFLINWGASIQIVKLTSALVFILRPMILNIYVKRKYKIINKCDANNEAIKQRWDGLGHHIAYLLHNNTDIVLLTIFSNVKEVSVYSVHFMVVSSIKTLIVTFSSGLEAAFGNMIVKNEKDTLERNFRMFEFFIFTATTILFISTAFAIIPFISLYTEGVNDVNYYRPVFAYLLIAAEAIYCIRIPYNAVILAAGHYKQTKKGAFLEAGINIVISLICVNIYGIVGVALGTLFAMLYRTLEYAVYLSKNILKRNIKHFLKRCIIYFFTAVLIIVVNNLGDFGSVNSYLEWFLYGVKITLLSTIITLSVGIIFYYNDMKNLLKSIKRIFLKKKLIKEIN